MGSAVLLAASASGFAAGSCPPAPEDPAAARMHAVQTIESDLHVPSNLSLEGDAAIVAEALSASSADGTQVEFSAAVARAFGAVYGTTPPTAASAGGALEAWSNEVAARITPRAILISEPGDRARVRFAAVHWPSPLAPRLRVVRIPDALQGRANRDQVLELLGTCAVPVDEWVAAPEDVAVSFLDQEVHAAMLIAGFDRDTGEPIERWIDPDSLVAALRFEDPRTARLDAYSAWFAGDGPGPLAIGRLLPRLRATLGPGDLWDLYRSLQ